MSEVDKDLIESVNDPSSNLIIAVDKNGKLFINGEEREIKDLDAQFLDHVVTKSLDNNVFYDIEGENPIGDFFKTLEEGTKEGSELRNLYKITREKSDESDLEGIETSSFSL